MTRSQSQWKYPLPANNHNWQFDVYRQFKNETHQPQELTKKGSSGTVWSLTNTNQTQKWSPQHLNIEQRNLLYQLSQGGNLSQRQMAVWLGCYQSTISRELRRNQSSLGCYLPDTAQAESETRRKNAKQPFKNISESALELVKEGLKDYHSPEQIAGRLKKAGQESLSHETIYQMIYQNYPWLWKVSRVPTSRTRKKKESKWSKK